MALEPTAEQLERYRSNRRKKYAENAEWRAHIKRRNSEWWTRNSASLAAARKARRVNDPEWREQQNRKRRGRDQRGGQLKVHYGISLSDYQRMLEGQGHACAICGMRSDKTLHVDHCHQTDKVRALLCTQCNVGLGYFRDNPFNLSSAITYLIKHNGPQYVF